MVVMLAKDIREAGFTVLEVLIGIGIFVVVVPSIIVSVVTVASLNDRAGDLTRANIIAEEKIESLRSAGYNTLVNGTYDFESELDPSFTYPRSASYQVTTPTAGIKQIDLTITYTDREIVRELVYTAQMSELGVAQ